MKKVAVRRVAAFAMFVTSGVLITACAGAPTASRVANLGHALTTSAPSGAAGRSTSSRQAGPTEGQLLKYAQCMRSHGLRNFPDPSPSPGGGFAFKVLPGLNPRSPSPQFASATRACERDVPASLANLTPAKMAANALKYTVCMRDHGEPDFPDPNAQGLIKIDPTGTLDPNAPQFQRALEACRNQDNGGFDEEFSR